MKKINVLVIGNGGREHALGWKVAHSPLVNKVYVAPGNAGTFLEPMLKNVPIDACDISGLLNFAQNQNIGLTIVGPEAPLMMGIVDVFRSEGQIIFGPTQAAAQLEGSKIFTKKFLNCHGIPTAAHQDFTDQEAALNYVQEKGPPIVIKADGLAAGKGVVVAMSQAEAQSAIKEMLSGNAFGNAGHRIVIEEFLEGEEASFIVMVDGKNVLPMATSQDHKKAYDGDKGPNTGGMGAYSPAPVITNEIYETVMQKIIMPTVQGMAAEGHKYTGFLYAGLIIPKNGEPKVIEFNCRFGDPETQPIMLRMRSDLIELCLAATEGKLDEKSVIWDERSALGVVLASQGYPGEYEKGHVISGLPYRETSKEKIFHSGTQLNEKNNVVTSGGRVLCLTALGSDISEARRRAYQLTKNFKWEGCFFRKDIGDRAIERKK